MRANAVRMAKADVTHSHSEDVLAARLRLGDLEAFTAFFRTYYSTIVRFLERYLSKDRAEDIAQDVFVLLWENRAKIDPSRSLRALLFTTARNRALNALAHDTVTQQYAEDALRTLGDNPEVSPALSPDATIIASELVQIAESRVATLPPRLREIYYLNRHAGLSAPEIAEMLGTSIQTVYNQLSKVAQALHPVLRAWMEE